MARLTGMKEICNYEGKSEATMLDLIRNYGYPAKKIKGHIWESETSLAEDWRKSIIAKTGEDPSPTPKPKKPKRKLDRHKKK